eukprot:TRINITY_DN7867_c0_g1_i1.p1 TRINITY_DN7867_c0_g1~~TRINITY_DN7867_c0_g1_i1.p1  ORF type:complete len:193 (-),score=64.06 TRINITY_DN7867_c0_g1_i1:146-724(-)
MSEKSTSTMGDKVKKIYKPVLGFLCVLVIILSIAGAAISAFSGDVSVKPETGDLISTLGAGVSIAKNLKTAQDLFICIIIFSVLAILLSLFVKFQKSGDQSKYEINEKSEKSTKGLDNVAFDGEKGVKEKWMDNYVPYGQFPKGSAIEEEVTVENEKDNKTLEKVTDSNKDDEKWKENYVPYEEEEKKTENE